MQTLTNKGLKITLENGRLAVAPKTALTDDLREFIRVNKKQLLSELQTLKRFYGEAFISNLKSAANQTVNVLKAYCTVRIITTLFALAENLKNATSKLLRLSQYKLPVTQGGNWKNSNALMTGRFGRDFVHSEQK